MTPDEAERLYQHVYEKVSEVVCELPFNYSMADGLLYIARAKAEEERGHRRAVVTEPVTQR